MRHQSGGTREEPQEDKSLARPLSMQFDAAPRHQQAEEPSKGVHPPFGRVVNGRRCQGEEQASHAGREVPPDVPTEQPEQWKASESRHYREHPEGGIAATGDPHPR